MHCPVCISPLLQPIHLEAQLLAYHCAQCEGHFLTATDYWRWRNQHGEDVPEAVDPLPVETAPESPRAKQCPGCRHLMLPYRVAIDLPFTVDHCGTCNGIWFDRHEWAVLARRNVHDNLHQVFAAPWQRRLRMAAHVERMQAIYDAKFGHDDYAEARRVKAWIDRHPQREALRAYLIATDPYEE